MKNWSLVWNPYCRWLGVASQPYSIYSLFLPQFRRTSPTSSPMVDYTCQSTDSFVYAFGSWPCQLVQVIFEVAKRFGERLPKRYVFKKSRDQKDGWFLWGGWTISIVIGDCSVVFWGWNFDIWSPCEGGGVAACGALALRRYAFAVYSEEGKVTCSMVLVLVMF